MTKFHMATNNQTPITKHQIITKHQYLNHQTVPPKWCLGIGYSVIGYYLVFGIWCLVISCGGESIFTSIGTHLANPLTVAVDSTNARAYIVNSNNKVLYTEGSLHVVNIATPASPTRVNTTTLESFSGQIFLDATSRVAFIPNRLSDDVDDKSDHLLRVDVNEVGGSFLAKTSFDANGDPFGSAFFTPGNLLLTPTREGTLDFYNITTPSQQSINLKQSLSDGGSLSTVDATFVTVVGSQAIVSRASGGLLVVNLNELTTSGVNPVDYYISDVPGPRGVATDGTVVFVASVETNSDGVETPSLLVLNLASLTASTTNTTTTVKDKDTDGLLVTSFALGTNPQQVVVGTTEGFVTNLGSDTVTVFNLASRAKVTDITVGDEPFGLALYSPGGVNTHLLVCNSQSNTVSVVDVASRTVVGTYQ